MPDVPDYSRYLPNSTRFSLTDMGDLAVRLGSPVYYDRRGEVVYYDTFKHGLSGWTSTASGTGSSVKIVPGSRMYSGFCARLKTGTTLNKLASIVHTENSIGAKRYGIELCLGDRTGSGLLDIFIYANLVGGGFRLGFRYDFSLYQQYLLDENDNYVVINPAVTIGASADNVSHIKIVADFDTGKYQRMLLKSTEIDISQYNMKIVEDENIDELSLQIIRTGDAVLSRYTDINHVILTANEP